MSDSGHVARAFEAGASGFMRKDAGTDTPASLITYVKRGGMVRPASNGEATASAAGGGSGGVAGEAVTEVAVFVVVAVVASALSEPSWA